MPMIFIFGFAKKDENEKYLDHFEVRRRKFFEIKNFRRFFENRKNIRTLKLSFEAPSEPIFDRLDIFSDTIDTTNTLVLFKIRQTTP